MCHFFRTCKVWRYSFFPSVPKHLGKVLYSPLLYSQEFLRTCVTYRFAYCVSFLNKMLVVGIKGESGSEGMNVRGRDLIIALASARKVVRTSWVCPWAECSFIILFNIRRVTLIISSHAPPLFDAWGGLNIQTVPLEYRKSMTGESSVLIASIWRGLTAPIKLVPLSER